MNFQKKNNSSNLNFIYKLIKNSYLNLNFIFILYYFFIFFSYPLLFKHFVNSKFHNNYNLESQFLLAAYFFIILISIFLFKKFNIKKFDYHFKNWSTKRTLIVLFMMPIGIIFLKILTFFKNGSNCSIYVHLLSPNILYFIYQAFLLSLLLDKNKKINTIVKFFFIITSFIFIFNSIYISNSRFELIIYFYFIFLLLIFKNKSIFLFSLFTIIFLFLFSFHNAIKNTFPKHHNQECNFQITIIKSDLYIDFMINPELYDSDNYNDSVISKLLYPIISRTSQHTVFSKFVEKKDTKYNGETLSYIKTSFIPNLILEKNIPINGNVIGREFNLIDKNDYGTGVGPTLIGELYINNSLLPFILIPFLSLIFWFFSPNGVINSRGLFFYSILIIILIHGLEGFWYSYIQKLFEIFVFYFLILFFLKKDSPFEKIAFLR